MKTKTPAPMTKEGLDALVDLCETLDSFGVYDVQADGEYRSIHLVHQRLVEAILATGAEVRVTVGDSTIGGTTYGGEFYFKGAKVYGVLYRDELKAIGYRLNENGLPVPLDKSATA